MNITINSQALLGALAAVSKALPAKANLPILENILIEGHGDFLTATAFDSNLGVIVKVNAAADAGKKVALPGKLLSDIIRTLPDCEITLTTGDVECVIDWGFGQSTIPAFDAKEFPKIPRFDGNPNVVLKGSDIRDAVAHTVSFASKDEVRPQLCGVFLNCLDGAIDAVCSDGKGMAIYTIAANILTSFSVVVPTSALNIVRTFIPADTDVHVYVNENNVFFATDSLTISVRRIVGNFPKYTSVIPQNNENIARFKTAVFTSSVSRISSCANKITSTIKMTLSEGVAPIIAGQDVGFGIAAQESVPEASYTGANMEVGLSSDFLLRIAGNLKASAFDIKFSDHKHAVLVEPADPASDNCKYVIMPVATA